MKVRAVVKFQSAVIAATLVAGAATAADLPSRKSAPAPVPVATVCADSEGIPTDAFGFTTGSDVADRGNFGPSLSYFGGFGARGGRSAAHSFQLQGSYGLAPCLEVGPYLLGGVTDALDLLGRER